MKFFLLIALIGISLTAGSQVTFEIFSPNTLRGVYPCMNGNPVEWPNTPSMLQSGNWFSDTLQLANDGISLSGCNPQLNYFNGKIVLVNRAGCNLNTILMNLQNAGASGALIMDTITGRPLKFSGNSFSHLVTIPFVIISKDEGQLLQFAIENNEIAVVGFGNKTGSSTTDLGLYMERSMWSGFGVFPLNYRYLPEAYFGAWIFNRGTTDVNNVQLRFWLGFDSHSANDTDTLSNPVDIPAGDSAFVNFFFPYRHNQDIVNDFDTLRMGYTIENWMDDDTLDNRVENYVLVHNTRFSQSYFTEDSPDIVDGWWQIDPLNYINYEVIMNMNEVDTPHVFRCIPTTRMYIHLQPPTPTPVLEISLLSYENISDIHNNTIVLMNPCIGNISYSTGLPGFKTIFNTYTTQNFTELTESEIYGYQISDYDFGNSVHIAYTTDMYFDERRRQLGIPTVGIQSFLGGSSFLDVFTHETPLIYFEFWNYIPPFNPDAECTDNLEEQQAITVALFPNPARDVVSIKSDITLHLAVINTAEGRMLKTIFFKDNTTSFSVSDLPPGIYFVTLFNKENDFIQTVRLLVE